MQGKTSRRGSGLTKFQEKELKTRKRKKICNVKIALKVNVGQSFFEITMEFCKVMYYNESNFAFYGEVKSEIAGM